jgi:hypothetical protein
VGDTYYQIQVVEIDKDLACVCSFPGCSAEDRIRRGCKESCRPICCGHCSARGRAKQKNPAHPDGMGRKAGSDDSVAGFSRGEGRHPETAITKRLTDVERSRSSGKDGLHALISGLA